MPSFNLSLSAKYLGAVSGDETGAALAVGDVTGDGQADLITSAPLNESTAAPSNSGIIYIVKNTGAAPATTSLFSSNTNIFRIQNLAPQQVSQTDLRVGTSLAVADVNGDGSRDLVVGIPGYDGPAGADSGAVFVFYGPVTAHRTLSSADLILVGASAGELAGTSVARVGDSTGDGMEEILVGAPGSGAAVGKAYLVHGGQPTGTVSLGALIEFSGSPGDRAGTSVAAGDFNADGLPDMLIGAPGYQSNQGAAFLIHGDEPLLPTQSLLGFTVIEGEGVGDQAGHAVASAGDFNGDGVEDALIGAPYANGGSGGVYLLGGEVPRNWYADNDGDFYGDLNGTPTLDCVPPAGQWVLDNTDCNDADASINPEALELCSTVGVDDNCNGQIDEEGATDAPYWATDIDADGYVNADMPLIQTCDSPGAGYINDNDKLGYECWGIPDSDNDPATYEGAPEVCDNKDNNCNAEVDDGNAGVWYVDVDGDGYGSDQEFFPYTAPCGAASKPGYVTNKNDCNDRDASVHPLTRWYVDGDGDGIGNNTDPYVESCTKPAGPYVRRNDDCDDADNTVRPEFAEVCEPEDGPQKDNNCIHGVDDTLQAITWFKDMDGDGFGDAVILGRFCGKPANSSKVTGDCDDGQPQAFPTNVEVCEPGTYADQIDNDCNGKTDESPDATWWIGDGDDDQYRGNVFQLLRCVDPNPNGVDGAGADPSVRGEYLSPSAPVDCNDSDSGATTIKIWYPDTDSDLCGNPDGGVSSCYNPSGVCGGGTQWVTTSGPGCI
ncbi:MAG: FG-GAP repeat protein [Myxococcaceae bacterium]|nr:FG-GAP repeat protein [Myxococcaceae bacterium]